MTETINNSKLAIVIPAWNEEHTIGNVIADIHSRLDCDIIVVDDASTDTTRAVASRWGVTVLPLCFNVGAWGAMQTGLRFAVESDYDAVITMDGDGQHRSEDISRLLAAASGVADCDVVIGACTARGSRLRRFAWRWFRQITGVGIEDITSGFRLYNRSAMATLVGRKATLLDYQDVGVLMLLQKAGLSIVETNVEMLERQKGQSHIYRSWATVAYYMLVTTILSLAKGTPLQMRLTRYRTDTI